VQVTYDDARKVYEKAATAGGRPFMSSCIMFIGVGRVGTSSTMKSLFGVDFKNNEQSNCCVQLGDCTLDCAHLLDWTANKAHTDYTSQGIASMLTTVTQEKQPGTLPIASKEASLNVGIQCILKKFRELFHKSPQENKLEEGESEKIGDAGKGTGSGDQEGVDEKGGNKDPQSQVFIRHPRPQLKAEWRRKKCSM